MINVKHLSFSLLFSSLLFVPSVFAAQVVGNFKLNKVTLFMQGAELDGSLSATIPKGESEILITNIGRDINVNSINVGIGNSAMILSTTLDNNYLIKKEESSQMAALTQTLKQLENDQNVLKIKQAVVNEEIKLLEGNRIEGLAKSNGSISEAKQVINFIKDNLIIALTEQLQLATELAQLQEKITSYQSQLKLEQGYSQMSQPVIKLKVLATQETELPINLSYVTSKAGWRPIYDVRVSNINSPLVLTYKANIYQYSGLNWSNVDFTLSTANPSEGINLPTLTPWTLAINNGNDYRNLKSLGQGSMAPVVDVAMSTAFMAKEASFTDYVVANNSGINLQYHINLPYTITGYSQNNIVTLKAKEVDAKYHYVAVPKLDNAAFLQAQISDWDKLSLLPGESTVFFEGNYVGQGYITTQGLEDDLAISLGRDKSILISRNQDLNSTSKPTFFGNNVSQQFAYTINLRNTKSSAIDITVYDQLPVIQNKILELKDLKYGNANYNKDTGRLTWNANLAANATQDLSFGFTLVYPKSDSNRIIGL